jgi:lipopolysaccharide export system permease protein
MDGITRYILRQLIIGMVLVTAGMTCVVWLTQSLRFIDMIVNRSLGVGQFLYLTLLLLPNFLSVILPVALFAVVVFTYNKLIADRELIVMRSAGLSQIALARPVLIMAFAVVGFSYSLNAYFLPESYRLFRELQWDARFSYSQVLLQEGAFNTLSKDITVYVRQRSSDGELHGILVHDSRDPERPQTWMAARGGLVDTSSGPRVVMFDGTVQEVDRTAHRHSVLYFDQTTLDIGGPQKPGEARFREPRERLIQELLNIEQDEFISPRDLGKFQMEAHKRLSSPWLSMAFSLIGLGCLLAGTITRRGQTRRIGIAVGLVVMFQATTMGLENLCARMPSMMPLIYVNIVVANMVGIEIMMIRPRRRVGTPEPAAAQ